VGRKEAMWDRRKKKIKASVYRLKKEIFTGAK